MINVLFLVCDCYYALLVFTDGVTRPKKHTGCAHCGYYHRRKSGWNSGGTHGERGRWVGVE